MDPCHVNASATSRFPASGDGTPSVVINFFLFAIPEFYDQEHAMNVNGAQVMYVQFYP